MATTGKRSSPAATGITHGDLPPSPPQKKALKGGSQVALSQKTPICEGKRITTSESQTSPSTPGQGLDNKAGEPVVTKKTAIKEKDKDEKDENNNNKRAKEQMQENKGPSANEVNIVGEMSDNEDGTEESDAYELYMHQRHVDELNTTAEGHWTGTPFEHPISRTNPEEFINQDLHQKVED